MFIILLGDIMSNLLIVTFKTIFFYFFIAFAYRIMGKREIGQLGVIDLIVSILIAELVAISIENVDSSIFITVVPITILVILEVVLAYVSIKSRKVRNFFDGKPSLIINKGIINYKEMVKQRYSIDDLLLQLRQQKIKSISEVEYAFLEINGQLSVFKYNPLIKRSNYPMPLIVDGIIQTTTLKNIKKSQEWLLSNLQNKNLNPEDVFYAFYKKPKIYIIKQSC